jgi:feruloyl-CoA synthase
MLYGGAGLPQHVQDRLQAQAVSETGCRIMMTSGYGSTETVSAFMVIYFETDRVGIGLPAPGVQVKLVPYDHRYEIRVRGPNVMSGYLNDPENTARAFDDEGFYRMGDLGLFHDPADYGQGLAYAGRLAEEFKLDNGNWVYRGACANSCWTGSMPNSRMMKSSCPGKRHIHQTSELTRIV